MLFYCAQVHRLIYLFYESTVMQKTYQNDIARNWAVHVCSILWTRPTSMCILAAFLCQLYTFPIQAEHNDKQPSGRRVALVSGSTEYDPDILPPAKEALEKAGYVVTEKYLDQVVSDFGYVNTDAVRAENIINAMKDDDVDIVWFVAGGGGSVNLLPSFHEKADILKQNKPKILIGFSDVTSIHQFVNETLGWPSVHGVLAKYSSQVAAGHILFETNHNPL